MALVPFSYNAKSLLVRRSATVLTIVSIGATVAVFAGVLSLRQGFETMFTEHGRENVAVFLRPGSNSEGESGMPRERADVLVKSLPEIVEDADGLPLAARETFLAVRLRKQDGGETNVPIRGVEPASAAIRGDDFRISAGRMFERGSDEVIVGEPLVGRIRGCELGDVVLLNTTPFRVVGTFQAEGPFGSEIWGDVERMMEALERPEFSRVLAVLEPGTDLVGLSERLEADQQAPAKVLSEKDYFRSQTTALSGTLLALGTALGVLMGLAAVFTGTNTMLAAISARTREIGILLGIGFRPGAIFLSFLLEAMLLGALGGLLGCLLALPLNGIDTGTMNPNTFTEIAFAFRLTPPVLIQAAIFSLCLGALGGALPAWKACRLQPTTALRR